MAKGWFITGLLTGLIIGPIILSLLDKYAPAPKSEFVPEFTPTSAFAPPRTSSPLPGAPPRAILDVGIPIPGRTPVY